MSTKYSSSLSQKFWGVQSWLLLVVFISLFIVVIFAILCICFICYRHRKSYQTSLCLTKPIACKQSQNALSTSSLDRRLLSGNISEIELNTNNGNFWSNQPSWSGGECFGTITGNSTVTNVESVVKESSVFKDGWRGNRISFKEIEIATNGLAEQNLIGNGNGNGNGNCGAVYRGILLDNTRVAVKRLVSNSCQQEDFIAEMEAIGYARHKNLVKLLAYNIEGTCRMLVYEYVDNENLYHWLHECPELISHLTWSIRMNIIEGVAKGLVYLHEDAEPKVFHGCLKSSNILLDHQWNPKISDFGLTKILGPVCYHIVFEKLGCSSPDCGSRGGAVIKSDDVYAFGVLIMEIVTGRSPLDPNQPQEHLIDWLKSMVQKQKISYVVDSKLPEMPPIKELKRVLLIALRCVDPDVNYRPRMGDVIHMLKPSDLFLCKDLKTVRDASRQILSDLSPAYLSDDSPSEHTDRKERSVNQYHKLASR